ncbi:MAG: twin-arginine translocase TatA/TatE family subunit [Pirellulales bacterium]|nr:twin-arginine translocase TatA/TatE family subunit [Pirellulales bacterium]
MIIVGLVALLLFGNRLPEVMRGMGQGVKEFQDGLREGTADDGEAR